MQISKLHFPDNSNEKINKIYELAGLTNSP